MWLASLPDSRLKFKVLLNFLGTTRDSVAVNGFEKGGLKMLQYVYGDQGGLTVALLTQD